MLCTPTSASLAISLSSFNYVTADADRVFVGLDVQLVFVEAGGMVPVVAGTAFDHEPIVLSLSADSEGVELLVFAIDVGYGAESVEEKVYVQSVILAFFDLFVELLDSAVEVEAVSAG